MSVSVSCRKKQGLVFDRSTGWPLEKDAFAHGARLFDRFLSREHVPRADLDAALVACLLIAVRSRRCRCRSPVPLK